MTQEIERGFEIGNDAFGHRVTVSRRLHYTGKVMWKIVIHPDGPTIDGLSDENMRELISTEGTMDAFQRAYPHLKWGWLRRKWFMLRYDAGMLVAWIGTRINKRDANDRALRRKFSDD